MKTADAEQRARNRRYDAARSAAERVLDGAGVKRVGLGMGLYTGQAWGFCPIERCVQNLVNNLKTATALAAACRLGLPETQGDHAPEGHGIFDDGKGSK